MTTRHLQLSSVSFHHGNRKTANSDSEEADSCRTLGFILTLTLHGFGVSELGATEVVTGNLGTCADTLVW